MLSDSKAAASAASDGIDLPPGEPWREVRGAARDVDGQETRRRR